MVASAQIHAIYCVAGIGPEAIVATRQNGNRSGRGSRKAKRVIDRAPSLQGWHSTDTEEIERRRWRGRTEITAVEACEASIPYFGTFRVGSGSGGSYDVEIRSLDRLENSCGCADHRVNGLGTCKHIEGVLAVLRRRGVRAFADAARTGSPRVELFLSRAQEATPCLTWPSGGAAANAVRRDLAPFLTDDGALRDPSPAGIEALLAAVNAAPSNVRRHIRASRYLPSWTEAAKRREARAEARTRFLAEVEAGRQTLDLLRHKLLPYQREGMLHLAFGERALLADDMGLGKTIQAIAACELLRHLKGVSRVLVVCPASLKGEWQEQVARFSGADTLLVHGGRPQRLAAYTQPPFFTVVNYEQVVIDADEINERVKPDIVILDEAQRIKNWHTKTAAAVKSLVSPHAFVLTGTPIENRIDEIYSIVQYLDPGLLGPLFRFNRDFYQLDERGRPVDYKNLEELQRRLKPVMLRRRKHDVETELPGRTVTNYLVGMADEQRARYDEYKAQTAKLAAIAKRRPLTPKEFDKLQLLLACMRMLCDTPFILDPSCRLSPKLEELERVLAEVLADPERKVIIFSEWERMLTLVRELAQELGLEFAWHTGSVPQERRRAEIARFKRDPDCRLFLSTDSGSVGLNLQAASVVINVDLPWNPARLEQRIARAWRKHQHRPVDVINLVTEDSIEHNMLGLLSQKQALADGVLDGAGDLKGLRMPSGRGAMVERIAAVLEPAATPLAAPEPPAPDIQLRDELVARHGGALVLLEAHRGADGVDRFLVVIDGEDAAGRERERLAGGNGDAPQIEVLDRFAYDAMQRLIASGILRPTDDARRELVRSPALASTAGARDQERAARGAELLGNAERKLRMALLLAERGFAEEAAPVLTECVGLAAQARAMITGSTPPDEPMLEPASAPSAMARPAQEAPRSEPETLATVTSSMERLLADLRGSLQTFARAA
ncbi:DEAD/DEAH box helicase [Vineibacter terrae]|uniref:DEAD/DEAH box helicase n=1 Tax=Vineibacter terrae TaxID=2586908 RepID=UPI002E32EB29|nr:DEAD/DEAH box helicase [Vineibacter terrae]HEX2889817.1 DEAD/DEAH box helicase [Vineibacter terrae]